jgi:hypothetical protein
VVASVQRAIVIDENQRAQDVDKGVLDMRITGFGGRDVVTASRQWNEERAKTLSFSQS